MSSKRVLITSLVAPFTGAWIEIDGCPAGPWSAGVAPFTGAWIEISARTHARGVSPLSLPSRERGLKFVFPFIPYKVYTRRSLHGSVD